LGAEVAGRYQLLAGDFFQTVPEGGDAYILKSILHDWNDHDAIAILRNVNTPCAPTARLLSSSDYCRNESRILQRTARS
jgi:hypothetical protein